MNEKADNATIRLLLLERKVRELKKEVQLLRMGKKTMEEDEENKEEEETMIWKKEKKKLKRKEIRGKNKRNMVNRLTKKKKNGDGAKQEVEEEDSSSTEFDTPPLIRKTGHKYGLREREGKKFSDTVDTPLILTPLPPASPH